MASAWRVLVLLALLTLGSPTSAQDGEDEAYSKALAGKTAFTIQSWVYLNGYGTDGAVIWSRQAANDVYGFVGPDGSVRFRVGTDHFDTPKETFAVKRWGHVGFVYAEGKGKIYVNGVLKGEGNVGEPPAADKEGINVGDYWNDEKGKFKLDGRVHQVKIHPKALTAEEIGKAYQASLSDDRKVIVNPK